MGTPPIPPKSARVDVVVIGGGIQGVLILSDLLERKYSAVLLERNRPGSGQTGHSHLFLHQGHMFATGKGPEAEIVTRMKGLKHGHDAWMEELKKTRLAGLKAETGPKFYAGFRDNVKARDFAQYCRQAEIACVPDAAPPELANGWLDRFYSYHSTCLNAHSLMSRLLDHENAKSRVSVCDHVDVEGGGKSSFVVRIAHGPDKPPTMILDARAVVFAAGAGNQKLIQDALIGSSIRFTEKDCRQQTVKTYMLVIQAKAPGMSPISGCFFELNGIFVAPRLDQQGLTTWLVADRQRFPVFHPGEWTRSEPAHWFQRLRADLEKLVPDMGKFPDQFKWGIYESPKAEIFTTGAKMWKEGGALPYSYQAVKCSLTNAWLTWPTFLTYAPLVSRKIVEEISIALHAPSGVELTASWDDHRVQAPAAVERWQTTPLLDWGDFRRAYC